MNSYYFTDWNNFYWQENDARRCRRQLVDKRVLRRETNSEKDKMAELLARNKASKVLNNNKQHTNKQRKNKGSKNIANVWDVIDKLFITRAQLFERRLALTHG